MEANGFICKVGAEVKECSSKRIAPLQFCFIGVITDHCLLWN